MDILGRHTLSHITGKAIDGAIFSITMGENLLAIFRKDEFYNYRRSAGQKIISEALIVSQADSVVLGIFPIPPILTPAPISKYVYLKFSSPVVLDPKQESIVYGRIPIEIGVYRQQNDEELLIDVFSIEKPKYALYGTPDNGVICRYKETDISSRPQECIKFQEASFRMHIKNHNDNVVKVSRVVIPIEGVILDHAYDNTELPGTVEMVIDSAFGKDVVNVRFSGAKVKRIDKTSKATREETLLFIMDTGY